MILTKIQANELGQMMREHITCILRMDAVRLKLDWTAEFTAEQIISCCDRMAKCLDCTLDFPENVQRELIQNPQFASWLARLMALAGKTADSGPEESRSGWDNLAQRLDELLKACQDRGISITGYSEADVLFAMGQLDLTAATRLTYLESFAPIELDDGTRTQIFMNLSACGTVPVTLDEGRRALLKEPFVGSRHLFASADFEDVWSLFQFCPALTGIARMLHQKGVNEHLTLTDYQYFAEDGAEYQRLLALVLQRLSADAASRFLYHWRENNCAPSELQCMERRTRAADTEKLGAALVSYTGYVNLIYGKKFWLIGRMSGW